MAPMEGSGGLTKRGTASYETGTYILRSLVEDVPLSADGDTSDVWITCVELWEGNLYIGTCAAEILHFVSLPPDPAEPTSKPTFILASRLQPTYTQQASSTQPLPGIQQILLLPTANKACILCNNTLTFYSLPELSPAFGGTTKMSNCSWVGGVDLNVEDPGPGGEVVMVAMRNRIRLVKIGEDPRLVKNIEYPGCLSSMRRNAIACVADAHSYALLDVDQQRKIPLFPISSVEETGAEFSAGQAEDISGTVPAMSRSVSSGRAVPHDALGDDRGHGRSTSLGTFVSGLGRRQLSPRSHDAERSDLEISEPSARAASPLPVSSPARAEQRAQSPEVRAASPDKRLLPGSRAIDSQSQLASTVKPTTAPLKPHILSPTASEFLLVTGTAPSEPGVGIFVNLEGDVVRGTLEFNRYPEALVTDGRGVGGESRIENIGQAQDGYVLAIVGRDGLSGACRSVEIQRWDVTGGAGSGSEWLDIPFPIAKDKNGEQPPQNHDPQVGMRTTAAANEIHLPEVGTKLRLSRLRLPKVIPVKGVPSSNETPNPGTNGSLEGATTELGESESKPPSQELGASESEASRVREEEAFAQRISGLSSQIVIWSGDCIWWVVRNPLLLRLDAAVGLAMLEPATDDAAAPLDRRKIIEVVRSIRGKEAGTELEFLTLSYVRQKASLLLLTDALAALSSRAPISAAEKRATEEVLLEGGADPRVILAMLYPLREDIFEGREGIWIHGGLIDVAERSLALHTTFEELEADNSSIGNTFLSLIKRYLMVWRRKKGFGSISNEHEVFQTVDAALLHVMLQLDSRSPRGPAPAASVRAELNAIVDQGLECFDRAITLLEKYRRLYVLSRFYQSRKMARRVLSTWRRILEGERDDGGEFVDGENEMRKYLVKIRDGQLVEEYGAWLARRDPKLGVQVFADDGSRVKFEPAQVVQLLRKESPDAVKEYLEHLVFGKHNLKYANDLISYYLDTVLSVLESSEAARSTLLQTYDSYRALRPPKPTYHRFITENATGEAWWHNRLRLLQLLGGSHGAGFNYDAATVLARIEPFQQQLVPEMIILDGRQSRHQQALRLLTHGLGDYDTAINYCLLGGASIFRPTSRPMDETAIPSHAEQARLFDHLLFEFLRIGDISDRVERTSELLDRFGAWYDVGHVLSVIPESWSVELISGFLVSAFRQLVREKSEAMVTKALSGAENLKVSADLMGKCQAAGPRIEAVD